jgi:hypothetical protein
VTWVVVLYVQCLSWHVGRRVSQQHLVAIPPASQACGSVGWWVGGSVGQWVSGLVGWWVGESVGQWVSGSVGRWVGGSVCQWVDG